MSRCRIRRMSLWFTIVMMVVFVAPSAAQAASETPYPGDLGQAIATFLIFLLLLLVLGKYAWKPIIAQLQRREEDIASRIEDAENRQAKADELAREYREQLDVIEQKMEDMLAQARKDANEERQEILTAARAEAQQVITRAQEDIGNASQAARRDLQASTAQMAAELAEQFLAKNLTEEDLDRLFEESTRQLARHDESTSS